MSPSNKIKNTPATATIAAGTPKQFQDCPTNGTSAEHAAARHFSSAMRRTHWITDVACESRFGRECSERVSAATELICNDRHNHCLHKFAVAVPCSGVARRNLHQVMASDVVRLRSHAKQRGTCIVLFYWFGSLRGGRSLKTCGV